jgi:hypothetical protein
MSTVSGRSFFSGIECGDVTPLLWTLFKDDPFDPRLRTHKIRRLSAQYGRTIYAVEIEGDLRSTFYLDGETVVSLIIGTHDIYRG